jgi:hypothetical protein
LKCSFKATMSKFVLNNEKTSTLDYIMHRIR